MLPTLFLTFYEVQVHVLCMCIVSDSFVSDPFDTEPMVIYNGNIMYQICFNSLKNTINALKRLLQYNLSEMFFRFNLNVF